MKNYKKILILLVAVFLLAAGCNKVVNKPVSPSTSSWPSASQKTQPRPVVSLTVTQTVEGSNLNKFSYEFKEGQTELDLLKATHQVDVKTYSGLGDMVIGIDGIKPDSKHFWEFFVNGKSSNVGASSYALKDGDKIEWKLSEISSFSQ